MALLVLGGLVLIGFVVVEQRATDPIVPLRLFKSRMVVAAVVTRFLAGMAMFGALSFVPLFLQSVTGASATGAGLVLTPFVLALGAHLGAERAPRPPGRLPARRVHRDGRPLTGRSCCSRGWSAALTPGAAMVDVLLAGVGMGLVVVLMLDRGPERGRPAGPRRGDLMTQFFMSIGGALGLSVMGAVMSQRAARRAAHGRGAARRSWWASPSASRRSPHRSWCRPGAQQDLARAGPTASRRAWEDR